MVNNVIGVVNYVIAARPSLLNFVIADTCELDFRHTGLPAEVVAEGWEHFLASLAAYAETGMGTPFGA